MKTDKSILPAVSLVLLVLVGSCSTTGLFARRDVSQQSRLGQSSPIERRFNQTGAKDPTVVESALDLSKKYAILSDEAAAMRQENQKLFSENRSLKERNAPLEAELKQTKKELAETNNLLVDMRVELNNWKNNILGFRNELRQADSEQLKALLEILKILGGEIKPDPNQAVITGQKEFANETSAAPAEQNKGAGK
jgi:septal ring factor EnvC (AmiA/AmiB activator)